MVSNAIDSYDDDQEKKVDVKLNKHGYTVTDHGSGMNPKILTEKFPIPSISGKDGVSDIGRFGVGFYTALAHLKTTNDFVRVTTNDGNKTRVLTYQI